MCTIDKSKFITAIRATPLLYVLVVVRKHVTQHVHQLKKINLLKLCQFSWILHTLFTAASSIWALECPVLATIHSEAGPSLVTSASAMAQSTHALTVFCLLRMRITWQPRPQAQTSGG